MKLLQTIAIAFLLITGLQCKKNSNGTDVPGLPPATQTGANTFGFLLNGVPWTPAGNNGSGNNLSIDYDQGINNGIFSVWAYNTRLYSNTQYIGIGIADSVNFIIAPKRIELHNNSIFRSNILRRDYCWFIESWNLNTKCTGFLNIKKYDKLNRIISGDFEYTLSTNCDTLKITKGRFDFKF
jgi:hypothetical protein